MENFSGLGECGSDAAGLVQTGKLQSYLNLKLTMSDVACLLVALGGTMLMNLAPVQKSLAAFPVVFVMAGVCFLRPISGFYFIAFAQTMPVHIGGSFNPAVIGVLAWLFIALLRLPWLRFGGLGHLWVLAPWLLWNGAVLAQFPISFSYPLGELEKAIIYTIIACQLVNASRGEYLKCLLGLSLGALSVCFSFWFHAAGLPVDLSTWGDFRGGFQRMGAAGTDSVMVWVGALMGLGGLLGINMTLNAVIPKEPWASRMSKLSLLALVIAAPPLTATMALGAYLGLGIIVGSYLLLMFKAGKAHKLIKPVFIAFVALSLMFSTNLFRSRDRVLGIFGWYNKFSKMHHTDLGSRSDVWRISLQTIAEHPLFGTVSEQSEQEIPDEYKRRVSRFVSHNVFLDIGRDNGIPGIIFYALFIFYPLARLIKKMNFMYFLPFFLFYVSVVIFLNVLSYPFYKTIWAFWILAAIVGSAISETPSMDSLDLISDDSENTAECRPPDFEPSYPPALLELRK